MPVLTLEGAIQAQLKGILPAACHRRSAWPSPLQLVRVNCSEMDIPSSARAEQEEEAVRAGSNKETMAH